MRNAIGIGLSDGAFTKNFVPVVASSGISRAIFVVPWVGMRFDDPTRLSATETQRIVTKLTELRARGVRPLMLLYGYEGNPTPLMPLMLSLVEPADMGARMIKIDPAQVALVVPGRTGLSDLGGYVAAEALITEITPAGVATLSRPLPKSLARGTHLAATLKFSPWTRPQVTPGEPNPVFEETLRGWLAFVRAVADLARTTLGDSKFDIELWNELASGAKFLDLDNYYDPPIDGTIDDGRGTIPRAILARTVAALRDPALNLPELGIGNGFSNTDWSYASSTEAPGVTAMDRHVSLTRKQFPQDVMPGVSRAVDATGKPDGVRLADGTWQDGFTPMYSALYPELPLNAVLPYDARRPGQLVRDLAPVSSLDINGVAHGRNLKSPSADVPPELWITAISTRPPAAAMAPAGFNSEDLWHFKAKTTLRTLAAYVSKGASLVAFYAPEDDLALVDYSVADGGVVLRALSKFRAAFEGPANVGDARSLSLVSVRGCDTALQVPGNGTPAHPGLLDRETVAFFPFQTTSKQFVAAAYIMTRDLLQDRMVVAPANRFDLPEKSFDLVIGGLAGTDVLVEASDPVSGLNVEVTVKARGKDRIVIALPLTDSVRLVRLTEP